MIVGVSIIALSKYLAMGYLWWQKTFFHSWGEIPPWFPRVGYVIVGVLFFLVGILNYL